jgi:CRISPR-associated protein Csd1
MILQALYQLAQNEKLMADPDYEPKSIAWIVRIDVGGKLLGIEGTHYFPPQEGKKKPKPIVKRFMVPREGGRTRGDRAFLLCDKSEYVFGLDPAGARPAEKLAIRFDLFKIRVNECLAATDDEGIKAISEFLEQLASGCQKVSLPESCVGNDLFAFVYSPDIDVLITERSKVRAFWKQQRASTETGDAQGVRCLVSGEPCTGEDLFPSIKKVPGPSTSGVALVSFNEKAFESYGWSSNENAPISRNAAEACSTALNRLLDSSYPDPLHPEQTMPKRNLRLSSDTAVCYWSASKNVDTFTGAIGALFDANPEEVAEMYQSIWRGKAPNIEDPSAFYALTLTGTQGRIIVRDWFESTVADVSHNLALHFADLDIVRNTPKPKDKELPPQLPLGLLLESLADPAKNRKEYIPGHIATAIVRAAFSATPYPRGVLTRAVMRYRLEIGQEQNKDNGWRTKCWNDSRAALIKAVLNRNYRNRNKVEEINMSMDPKNKNPGYKLGQLMAVMERIQIEALNKPNASVVDRYFAGASACPKSVFVRLLKNSRHHVRKIKDNKDKVFLGICWDRLLDELVDGFDPKNNGFPTFLDLDQQGFFIVGYHQMRKWLWITKEERTDWENDNPDAPRAYVFSNLNSISKQQ